VIRVVIVDDHPVVQLGLRVALTESPQIEVVGVGGTLADAKRLVAETSPDVGILDLRLSDGRATEAIGALRELHPALRVIILTGTGTALDAREALQRGASGYLTKDDAFETIADSVTAVMEGTTVVAPSVRADLVELGRAPALSDREREVLALVVEGCTNPEISSMLGVSVGTIRTHVSNILKKLDVADRTEATSLALRRGLV